MVIIRKSIGNYSINSKLGGNFSERIKKAARKLLLELGAPIGSKGFTYSVEILVDSVANEKPIINGSKIANQWGLKFGDSATAVDRSLRLVKETCLSKKTDKFKEIFEVLNR